MTVGTSHTAVGTFEIAPDEALILEVTPPECHFWNIHLGDYWGQSLDYTYRQTSLNGHQAVLDSDGVFRAVVAHRDPGVANWLDTAGKRVHPVRVPMVAGHRHRSADADDA